MKKTALMAAAAALMAASPAAATGGYLGIEYGSGESDILLGESDSEGWQGEGAVGFGGAGWGAQVDGSFGTRSLMTSASTATPGALAGTCGGLGAAGVSAVS